MTKKFPRLADLDFGSLDARQEAVRSPLLISDGYYDFQEAARRISGGSAWLLVGPKGAGKSAVFEHLHLDWMNSPTRFFNYWPISSSPIEEVLVADTGLRKGPGSTMVAWKLLLLGPIFQSFMDDHSATHSSSIVDLQRTLVRAGFLPPSEPGDIRGRNNTSSVKINFKILDIQREFRQAGISIYEAVTLLEQAVVDMRSDCQHVLAIDELDRLFGQSEAELDSVGALLDAIRDVNYLFDSHRVRAHVVLGIRHDMLANVPSTDSAKLRERAVLLDWSVGRSRNGIELWKIVSNKAKLSIPHAFEGLPLGDVRKAYLSNPVGLGQYNNIPDYLLSNTRYLPRDIVALMQSLQQIHPGSGKVTEAEARSAARLYGESYFANELQNNLTRTVPECSPRQLAIFFDALGSLPSRFFTRQDLEDELDGDIEGVMLKKLLRQLYHASGIGVQKNDGKYNYTSFDYRRVGGSRFSPNRPLILHNALVEAWGFGWK